MTSNQLQNFANREESRHNQVVEEETNRHNLAMESLQKDANAIQQERNLNDNTFNYYRAQLDAQIRDLQSQRIYATSYVKNLIDDKIANLQRERLDREDAWNVRANEIRAMQADLESRKVAELRRNNQAIETLQAYKASNDLYIAEKNLEFKNTELRENIGLKRAQLENEITRTEITFYDAFQRNDVARQNLYLNTQVASFDTQYTSARTRWLPFEVFWGGVKNAASAALPFAK